MKKNHLTIKNLLLLGTLSICWHSSTLAMEADPDKLEKKTKSKRTNEQASLKRIDLEKKNEETASKQADSKVDPIEGCDLIVEKQSICGDGLSLNEEPITSKPAFEEEEYFSLEIINYIIQFLNLSKDQNTLLALSTADTSFHELVGNKYTKANKREKHLPWQAPQSLQELFPSTLYILNSRMRTVLGLYVNIQMNMACDVDRSHFEKLCSFFITTPLFPKNTLTAMYVELLQLHLSVLRPTPSQISLAGNLLRELANNSLEEKKKACLLELSAIADQHNLAYQNEGALNFHYHKFVVGMLPENLPNLSNILPFEKLNNSFMAMMNQELLDLKRTPGLLAAGNFVFIWEKILDLEPVKTIRQLEMAAYSHYDAGFGATDQNIKLTHFTKAVRYFEKELEAIKDLAMEEEEEQTPLYIVYGNIGHAYSNIGGAATDSNARFTNFTKSAGYFEKMLEILEAMKTIKGAYSNNGTPALHYTWNRETMAQRAINYINSANAYYQAAISTTDQSIKAANLVKVVDAYGGVCRNVENDSEKFKYLVKAAESCEEMLKAIKDAGQTPTFIHYAQSAGVCCHLAKITENQDTKATNFAKAAEYYDEMFKVIKAEEVFELVAEGAYNNIVKAYLQTGLNATDFSVKILNFTKAAEGCEKMLEAMKAAEQTPTADHCAKTANIYFQIASVATDDGIRAANFTKVVELYANIASVSYQAGCAAANQDAQLCHFIEAAQYYEKMLKAMKDAGQTPTAGHYFDTAIAYLRAGGVAIDQDTKAIKSSKAAEYSEKRLEAMKARGEVPTFFEYENIAMVYRCAGEWATDPSRKSMYFTKAAEIYFESGKMNTINFNIKIAHFTRAAANYHESAIYTSIKVVEFIKAAECYEVILKAFSDAKLNPRPSDYHHTADAYFQAGQVATDQGIGLANFTKAAEYYEEKLSAVITDRESLVRQTPTAYDYRHTANAYFHAGLSAADVNVKIKNFTIAKTHLETSLEVGLDEETAQHVRTKK